MKKPLRFDGRGFSKEPPTPEELAEWRDRQKHYDDNFRTSSEIVQEAGLGWVSTVAKGTPGFLKAFGAISALLGVFATLKALGVI